VWAKVWRQNFSACIIKMLIPVTISLPPDYTNSVLSWRQPGQNNRKTKRDRRNSSTSAHKCKLLLCSCGHYILLYICNNIFCFFIADYENEYVHLHNWYLKYGQENQNRPRNFGCPLGWAKGVLGRGRPKDQNRRCTNNPTTTLGQAVMKNSIW